MEAVLKPKFNLGDCVYAAGVRTAKKKIDCPECFGKLQLRVTLGDESVVDIDCVGCARGCNPPTGFIELYEPMGEATYGIIYKVEIEETKIEYYISIPNTEGYNYNRIAEERNIFKDKDEALQRARFLSKEYTEKENKRILKKEKNTRTWAWNAHYHRDCIRKAEKEIVYHSRKLGIAKEKAKEDRKSIKELKSRQN